MSTPKFTPGPWRKGINDDSVVSVGQSEEQRGSANFEYYGGHLIAESIEKHNIPLIAAAPDLLEALKAFMALDSTFTSTSDEHTREIAEGDDRRAKQIATTVLLARAAIAKAEGGAV